MDQLAQSAESLRLFEETRERAGQEQLIREITEKLRQAPTLAALTRTAGEELGKVLGVSHSLVKVGVSTARDDVSGNGDERGRTEGGADSAKSTIF